MKENIDQNKERHEEELQDSIAKQNEENRSLRSLIKEANKQIAFGKEVAKQQQQNFKNHRDDFDQMEGDFIRFKDDFHKFRSETFNTIRGTKEDLQEQINSSDKFFGELTTQLQEDIKSIRHLATHEMRQQEKELVSRFSGQFEEVHEYMTKSVDHLKAEAK